MSGTPEADNVTLARTPLYDLHVELGARMVAFAGYHMPVQYPQGIIHEHQHTRAAAGLFDVSHMGQVSISGRPAAAALESLAPMDVVDLQIGHIRYGVFTDDSGGVLDDFMVANTGGALLAVVNAACKQDDIRRMRESMGRLCEIEFMTSEDADVAGIPCGVSRSGYTGEDGFEISVAAEDAEKLARKLLANPAVAPVGLGARDSLRLEAGLCLYGQDLNRDTTPVEAGLAWTISKVRRRDGARAGGFPGEERILAQLGDGPSRRLVGLRPKGRAPVRAGAILVDADGESIGTVTSGGFGPTVGGPVAMGYVGSEHRTPGTVVQALVRGKQLATEVVPLPFVERRYYRG
jgi:aminomethyltransferase